MKKRLKLAAILLSTSAFAFSARSSYAFGKWTSKTDISQDRQDFHTDDSNPGGHNMIGRKVNRFQHLYNLLSTLESKLQTRANNAKNGGKDVTVIQPILDEMTAKLADAKTQSDAAAALIPTIKTAPDKTTVIATIKADYQTILADLKTVRTDANNVRNQLKTLGF